MQLIDLQSGQPLNITDKVVTFKGEIGELTDVVPPRNAFEYGRVFVRMVGSSINREMTPSVIAAKFCNGEDVA